jgi:hypothetical protein
MNHIIFDIETGALPDEELRLLYTEKTLEEFAADCDKRWKPEKYEKYKTDGFAEFREKSALSPLTGEVVAIGYMSAKGVAISGQGDWDQDDEGSQPLTESDILAAFWRQYISRQRSSRQLIGWNIYGFDLAFLVQRSWRLGVDVPSSAFNCRGRWFNWDEKVFFDLMLLFGCGGKFISLDAAAKHFGLNGKNGEGKEFARLWKGTEEEREQARAYLVNDLEMPWVAAQRMGVV